MRFKVAVIVLVLTLGAVIFSLIGCDIYDSENKDWVNEVTIRILNSTMCPLDVFIDGQSEGRIEPGETAEETDMGRGIHLLEAYPWNDEQHSCDAVYTDNLESGSMFEWEITVQSACNICDPTPTPMPEMTPTPGGDMTPTPAPEMTATPIP